MAFGQKLKEERESHGLSLDKLSEQTRVPVRFLRALEEERFRDLPGGVFNRGFVRSYATACGLDPAATVADYCVAAKERGAPGESGEEAWQEFAEAVHRSRGVQPTSSRARWLGVLAMMAGVLVIAAGVLWVLVHQGIVHLPDHSRMVSLRLLK